MEGRCGGDERGKGAERKGSGLGKPLMAVKKYGYSGARIARFLGVTASSVNRYASLEEIADD